MLFERLPEETYHGEPHVAAFQGAVEAEYQKARKIYDDLVAQMRPSTASWGLGLYEWEYGIEPGDGKTAADRLAIWRAKRRGCGTATPAAMLRIAQSFSEHPARVDEIPEEYRFRVVLDASAAARQTDLIRAIGEAKPAHLMFGVSLLLRMSLAGVRLGARCATGTRLAVHPYLPGEVEARGRARIGAHWKWGQRLNIQPK